MAMQGGAALAMWWDMDPAQRPEFEDWHTHEHFPERLAIPGFRRASRWKDIKGDGFFVLYELEAHDTLSSPAYLARLNAPTPWSTKLMPLHQRMVRCQCRVLDTRGGVTARHAVTLRLSPAAGHDEALRTALREQARAWTQRPGLAGAHLLRTETPATAPTVEQQIRGLADGAADWILLVCGYDQATLDTLLAGELAPAHLEALGAAPGVVVGRHTLQVAMQPGDAG